MKTKILINARTSGKYSTVDIGGRPHIVTRMMPIAGDIAMNGIYYPDVEVASSYNQLNMLPAPNGHPVVNGINTPAFHPVANNKHNIGGFIRNPVKKGLHVYCDFCLDIEVANASDEGNALIARIKNGDKVGVSTGLTLNTVEQTGTDRHGAAYTRVGSNFNFDHVAILLNEMAAGEHAGTELVLNESGEQIDIATLPESVVNDVSSYDVRDQLSAAVGDGSWVSKIYVEPRYFIYEQGDKLYKQNYTINNDAATPDGAAVEVRATFEPVLQANQEEVQEMEKTAIVNAIICNSDNQYQHSDTERLAAMSDTDLCKIIASPVINATNAREALKGEFNFSGYEEFLKVESEFKVFNAANEAKMSELKTKITAINAALPTDGTLEQLQAIYDSASGSPATPILPAGGLGLKVNALTEAAVPNFNYNGGAL